MSEMCDKECLPLKDLKSVLEWKPSALSYTVKALRPRKNSPNTPKTLLCHDMMGGYLEDRFVNGSCTSDCYRFFHWEKLDIFVYFSHNFVTIPPCGWISAAHNHGVKVLGTFITEWDPGTKILEEIKSKELLTKLAQQLAEIAKFCGFDGWLLNIESEMGPDCGPFLEDLVNLITKETHRRIPDSLVLWYDSIVTSGKLKWQNELNEQNKNFFDLCDGIFLNYCWNEGHLERSVTAAKERKHDVYVGIDVFARNTEYSGGYKTAETVAKIKSYDLSAAIFAPGWVFETQDKDHFTENQYKFWKFPEEACSLHCYTSLPIHTTFCQGFGKKKFRDGKVIDCGEWFNLSHQQLQPIFQGQDEKPDGTILRSVLCTSDAYSGGGCLKLEGKHCGDSAQSSFYFRLFTCETTINHLYVSYTFKELQQDDGDAALHLKLRKNEKYFTLVLVGAKSNESDFKDAVLKPSKNEEVQHLKKDLPLSDENTDWKTRSYLVQEPEFENSELLEIGLSLSAKGTSISYLLGQLYVCGV